MKKHILAAGAAVLAIGFSVSMASAAAVPCLVAYQHPVKAAQIKAALTSTFVSCGNTGGATPNATTQGGSTPTCFPAQTLNEKAGSPGSGWLWGPKATASISFKAGKNKITGGLNTDPLAVDLYIQLKASNILTTGGPADNSLGKVQALSRATLIDRAETKLMTVVDFPTSFPALALKGKISKKTSATEILNLLNNPALPACTNIELLQVLLLDVNSNAFATLGTFLP
jgi:hypothetical protein